jgi:SAM-dependent methyltransferase
LFGSSIDYRVLKPLTHRRNLLTQEDLDHLSRNEGYTLEQAAAYLERTRTEYFAGQLPVDPQLSYLDVGCGLGELSVGLCLAGAHDVTGIDIEAWHGEAANVSAARIPAGTARPKFYVADVHTWECNRQFDVIFALGVMEHLRSPVAFLASLPRLLKPSGRAFVSIEPFHSPIGDHMHGFFGLQIPWRSLLFSEEAVLRLRRECYRPSDLAERFPDIAGGLNGVRFGNYLQQIKDAGLEVVMHNINPQLWTYRKFLPFRPLSAALTRVPFLRDYFIVTAYSILRPQANLTQNRPQ